MTKFNFDHSLTCTLFGAQQKCDKHRTFFRFTKRKKSSLIVLCFELYTARSRNRTYIAHFFRFWDWKSSSSINLYLVLYWARTWIATNNILSKLSFLKISRSIIDVISVSFVKSCNFLTWRLRLFLTHSPLLCMNNNAINEFGFRRIVAWKRTEHCILSQKKELVNDYLRFIPLHLDSVRWLA